MNRNSTVAAVAAACILVAFATVSAQAQEPATQPSGPMDIQKRVEAYRPYDGSGRYTMDKDDGVRGIQGLTALASRFGVKPYNDLRDVGANGATTAPARNPPEGAWQTERVIFKDVDTGATMIRYTNDRWAEQLSYFQGNWSADGKYIVFRRKPGMWEGSTPTHGPMAMNADGTGLRNVFRDYPMVRGEVCSPTVPDTCYAVTDTDKKIIDYDLATGKQRRVVRETARGWHMKISPDGKYLMNRADTSKGKGIWISSVDGKEFHEIAIPQAIHDSYCFHPSQKKIMFWYEGKFYDEGFVQCNFDGSEMTKVKVQFDWNHGDMGIDRGVHCEGFITRVQGNTWGPREWLFHGPDVREYYDDPADYNGYTSWRPKDQLWSYNTRILRRPWISEIMAFPAEVAGDFVVNRYRVCYTALWRGGALDCPNASPDGTKVLFNSNMLGALNIYGVVARLPERPTGVKIGQMDVIAADAATGKPLAPQKAIYRLEWKPPVHKAEIVGYRIYRSNNCGSGFRPEGGLATTTASLGLTVGFGETCYFAVTAVENSGLESPLSDPVCTASDKGRWQVFLNLDEAKLTPEMWVAFRGDASDLHYIWMRKKDGEGKATLTLTEAQQAIKGPATLWARVMGYEGAEFTVTAGSGAATVKTTATAPNGKPSTAWAWVKADKQLDMKDVKELVISSKLYGSAIDQIVLTDDAAFDPAKAKRIAVDPPPAVAGVKAEAASPYEAKLTWEPVSDKAAGAFSHYNVYCGASEDFKPDQTMLIRSPDKPSMVDWGLTPGKTVYYRVTAVDRYGQESAPSAAVKLVLPEIKQVVIEKDFAEAIDFDAPAKDTYVVWLKIKKDPKRQGSYIEVKLTGQAPSTGAASAPAVAVKGGGTWTAGMDNLAETSWLNYDQWGRFDLDAGAYTLRINNKSAVQVEKVIITNDQSYKPEGHVNVLSGW
ncbi:MAG: hypothetical protein ACE15C_11120 [Phycisphaerae bacterium]